MRSSSASRRLSPRTRWSAGTLAASAGSLELTAFVDSPSEGGGGRKHGWEGGGDDEPEAVALRRVARGKDDLLELRRAERPDLRRAHDRHLVDAVGGDLPRRDHDAVARAKPVDARERLRCTSSGERRSRSSAADPVGPCRVMPGAAGQDRRARALVERRLTPSRGIASSDRRPAGCGRGRRAQRPQRLPHRGSRRVRQGGREKVPLTRFACAGFAAGFGFGVVFGAVVAFGGGGGVNGPVCVVVGRRRLLVGGPSRRRRRRRRRLGAASGCSASSSGSARRRRLRRRRRRSCRWSSPVGVVPVVRSSSCRSFPLVVVEPSSRSSSSTSGADRTSRARAQPAASHPR